MATWTHGTIAAVDDLSATRRVVVRSTDEGHEWFHMCLIRRWFVLAGLEPHVGDRISVRWHPNWPDQRVYAQVVIGERVLFPPPDYPPDFHER